MYAPNYRGADKSFARPGRKQARKHVKRHARFQQHRDASCHQGFFFFLQGKAPKEIHAILTETLACFLPGRAKDLSAPLTLPTLLVILVQNFMKLEFSRQISEKYSNIRFHENPSSGSRVVLCGRTNWQTDRHNEANSLPFVILWTRLKKITSLFTPGRRMKN